MMQRTRVEKIGAGPGGKLHISYFETSQHELERAMLLLAAIHFEILEAFVEAFDGAFHRDAEWMRLRTNLAQRSIALARARGLEPPKEAE